MTGTLNVSIILKMDSWTLFPKCVFPLYSRPTSTCVTQTKGSKSYSHVHLTSPSIMICDRLVSFLFFSFLFFFSPSTEASEEPLVDLSDVLNTDADILGMLGKPSSDSGASYIISQAVTVTRRYEWSLSSGFAQSFSRGIFLTQQVYLAFTSWWFFFQLHVL